MNLISFPALTCGVLLLALSVLPAAADEPRPLPDDGTPMLTGDPFADARPVGQNVNALRHEVTASDDGRFDRVLRMETTQRTGHRFHMGIEIPLVAPLRDGDIFHVRMWARAVKILDETGQGRMAAHVRHMPHRQPAAHLAAWRDFGPEWQLLDIPIPGSRISAGAGQSSISLFVGGTQPQVIEVAELQVINYGRDFDPRDLPYEAQTYEGREEDAQWRKDALARIEDIRKGDLTVRVTDADGNPVEGAQVHVAMKRHAYNFGTAVPPNWILPDENWNSSDGEKFRSELVRLFNKATIQNELKWNFYEDWPAKGLAGRAVDWLESEGLVQRGHTLMWPSRQYLPQRVQPLFDEGKADELQEAILEHIDHIVTRFKGRLKYWDVINEPVDNNTVINLVGRERMVEWWKAAHRADPEAQLVLNENNLLNGQKVTPILEFVKYLKSQDAPIHGIGAQGHLGPTVSMHVILRNLDRLAEAGLPIEITEYDTVTPDAELQGDFTRDVMIAVFSHPATEGFTMWGFWDGRHWLNDAPIYFRDWEMKPAGRAYEDLVLNQWLTRETLATDADGSAEVPGFHGTYEVRVVMPDGSETTHRLTLGREGATLEVRAGRP